MTDRIVITDEPQPLDPLTMRIEVYRTRSMRRSQRWAWRMRAANGRIVATSGEGYTDRGHAVSMALRVARGVQIDPTDDGVTIQT